MYVLKGETLFEQTHSYMRLDKSKSHFLQQTGFFVKPVEVEIEPGETYQYVSIVQSLQAIFKNEEFASIYFESIA